MNYPDSDQVSGKSNRSRLPAATRALVLGLAYIAQLFLITEPTGGDFNTLYGVTTLFSKAGNVMLGWTHYLAFDLFMGSWEVEDAQRVGVPHWLVVPCLALTFVLGPVGLITYFVIRTVKITPRK